MSKTLTPHAWLIEFLNHKAKEEKPWNEINAFVYSLDPDLIVSIYQFEMAADGYFEKLEEERKTNSTPNKIGPYRIDSEGILIDAPGCCGECLQGQLGHLGSCNYGQGHFLCQPVPEELLEMAEKGIISCHFTNNRWTWYWNFD